MIKTSRSPGHVTFASVSLDADSGRASSGGFSPSRASAARAGGAVPADAFVPTNAFAPADAEENMSPWERKKKVGLLAIGFCLMAGVSVWQVMSSQWGGGLGTTPVGMSGFVHASLPPSSMLPAAPDEHAALLSTIEDPAEVMTTRSLLEGDDAARETGVPLFVADRDVMPPGAPRPNAKAWYVVDSETGEVLLSKNADRPYPIASISKLMGGMIYADTHSDLEEALTLTQDDKDYLQITRSRLRVGYQYRAGDLLFHSLLPSDNRATVALMRQTLLTPELFREAMNRRAQVLGMTESHFEEPTGLDPGNIASARDAAVLLEAALLHPTISKIIQQKEHYFQRVDAPVALGARSSNRLSHMEEWHVIASKTGFTYAAGSCLVQKMQLESGRTITMTILGAAGEKGRYPVAAALRSYLEGREMMVALSPMPDDE